MQQWALASDAKQLSYQVVSTFPHNKDYFTQGLVYKSPYLYESTGQYKKSRLIKYLFQKGQLKLVKEKRLPANIFAEGLTWHDEQLYLLTYRKQRLLIYDPKTFAQTATKSYRGEGWGLVSALGKLYMTNGDDQLYVRSKESFKLIHQQTISFNQRPLKHANELEWVKGYIAANIWYDLRIVFIEPFTGRVKAYIDLSELVRKYNIDMSQGQVANGIAYNADENLLYVTGKNWPKLFALSINFNEL